MIVWVIATGAPNRWVTADKAYGQAKHLQRWLEELSVFHVLAARCTDTVTARGPGGGGSATVSVAVKDMVAAVPETPGGVAVPGPARTVSGSMSERALRSRHPHGLD